MEPVKNILVLSTSNPYKIAGIAAYDIFKGFKEKGYSVKLVVENYGNYEEGIISVQSKFGFKINLLRRKLKNRILKLTYKLFNIESNYKTIPEYSFDSIHLRNKQYSTKKILNKAGLTPDVIIVIFSQYFISFKNLKELQEKTNAPILWQFADMFPFTGGCHYTWDCLGYKKLCENCPAFYNSRYNKISNKMLLERLNIIKNLDITAIIGSDWLIKRAQESTLFNSKLIKKIYLSLDVKLFHPFNDKKKVDLRKKYKINNDDYVILLMASYLPSKRKGISIILKSLSLINENYIKKNRIHLLIIGGGFELIRDQIPNSLTYSQVSFVERDYLPEIYNISNLFISASIQDVGPYTVTESLLCSVPVVALNHGYASEFIINDKTGITGILIEDDSPESLYKGIIKMIETDNHQLSKIKRTCRERTKEMISKSKQINEYIKLIKSLDNENK